jgi:hypothetical protein
VLEKVHLLKRRQAEQKIKNITGFLREALKRNYANPEFIVEERKKRAREETRTKHVTEQKRQRLEEQKMEIEKIHEVELHQLCEVLLTDAPMLLEEAVEYVFRENPLLRKIRQPGKTLLENYQEKPLLWVLVDQYFMRRFPEHFLIVRERFDGQITALEKKTMTEDQASA